MGRKGKRAGPLQNITDIHPTELFISLSSPLELLRDECQVVSYIYIPLVMSHVSPCDLSQSGAIFWQGVCVHNSTWLVFSLDNEVS